MKQNYYMGKYIAQCYIGKYTAQFFKNLCTEVCNNVIYNNAPKQIKYYTKKIRVNNANHIINDMITLITEINYLL